MAAAPVYYTIPGGLLVQAAAANTAVDGSGTLGTNIYQGPAGLAAAGRQILRVRAITAVATDPVAQRVSFFRSLDGGATKRFICDALIPDIGAVSAILRAGMVEVPELVGFVFAKSTNDNLYVAVHVAQATNIMFEYADEA